AARPSRYVYKEFVRASLASRTMLWSGLLLLAFIIYHLAHFTFGITDSNNAHLIDAQGRHDVYSMVVLGFRQPVVAISYVIAMLFLAAHMSHGVFSTFTSLGLNSPRFSKALWCLAVGLTLIVVAGNIAMPLAVLAGLVPLPGGH